MIMNIAKFLKKRRQELGISQAILAHHLGFKDKSSVAHLESGRSEWRFSDVVIACELLKLEIKISNLV